MDVDTALHTAGHGYMDKRHGLALATVAGVMYMAGQLSFTTTSNDSPSEDPSVPPDEVDSPGHRTFCDVSADWEKALQVVSCF